MDSIRRMEIRESYTNPSAADLVDAFLHAYDGDGVYVTLFMEDPDLDFVELQVSRIEYESGCAGTFLIGGNLRVGGQDAAHVHGFYNANRREGFLESPKKQ